jgi:hypothetical protein
LTNDKQLRQFKEIKCITVDELLWAMKDFLGYRFPTKKQQVERPAFPKL